MMKEFIKKVIPYSLRDTDAIEAWLEELAGEGLVLERDGYLGLVFRRTEPSKLRFRIDHTKGANLEQNARRREQLAERGWQYATSTGIFTIYRNEDLEQWELPEWGISPNKSLFWKFGGIWFLLIPYIILVLMHGKYFIFGGSTLEFIREDIYDLPILLILTLFLIVGVVLTVLQIVRVKKRKEDGSFSKRSYHTKERARRGSRRALFGLILCFLMPFTATFISHRNDPWNLIPIQNYQKVLHVPQLSELVKAENSKRIANQLPELTEGKYLARNEVAENKYFLMPREVRLYQEEGYYPLHEDGKKQGAYYDSFYYEMRTEDLEKKVFEELYKKYPYTELPGSQGAQIYYFKNTQDIRFSKQALLICHGKKIIQVTYQGDLDLKEYVYLFVQYLGIEENLTPRGEEQQEGT